MKWDWEEKKPHGLSKEFKNREMLWLWCRIEENGYRLNASLVSNVTSRANHLIASIADHETVGSLSNYQDKCFSGRLDDSEFKWISYHDERLVHWLLEMIWGHYLPVVPAVTSFDQSVLAPKERIELAFDLSDVPLKVKKEAMLYLRQTWSTLIEVDPSFDWVDKKDEGQCRWLVDEIRKSDFSPCISPDLNFSVDNEGRFLLAVNAFDRSGYPLKFKKSVLGELKTKWGRRERKTTAEKMQWNISVRPATQQYIKELAKTKKMSMGELIDSIVAEEMKRRG
jgi:hypothetical protein